MLAVSWNMAYHEWRRKDERVANRPERQVRFLRDDLKPDVALLQECVASDLRRWAGDQYEVIPSGPVVLHGSCAILVRRSLSPSTHPCTELPTGSSALK